MKNGKASYRKHKLTYMKHRQPYRKPYQKYMKHRNKSRKIAGKRERKEVATQVQGETDTQKTVKGESQEL